MGRIANLGAAAITAVTVAKNVATGSATPDTQAEQAAHYQAQRNEQRAGQLRDSTAAKISESRQPTVPRSR